MSKKITENTGTVQQISHNIDLGGYSKDTVITTTSTNYDWSIPVLLETIITEKGVEQIFRQDSNSTFTVFYGMIESSPRIYKNVYRIVKGKLKLTETIEGKYIPQKEESYEF